MKKLNIYLILLAGSILLVSCEEWLDVNQNPNKIVNSPYITENLQLIGVEGEWASRTYSYDLDYYFWNLWCARYDGRRSDFGRAMTSVPGSFWSTYTNSLKHATELYDLAKKNGNNHYQGIAAVIQAWNMFMLADYWDEAPMTQAMKGNEYPYPEYDDFWTIYQKANELIDEAITLFDLPSGPLPPKSDDYIGKGDIGRWTRFAWSLKARQAIRIVYAPGKTKSTQADLALDYLTKGMNSNTDEMSWRHLNTNEDRNYFFKKSENDESWSPSTIPGNIQLVNMLNYYNSPLLKIYFNEAEQGGYKGHLDAFPLTPGDNPSFYKATFLNFTQPDVIMRYHECLFLKAEAYALKGQWPDAKIAMDAGIRADMEYHGVPDTEIETYLAQPGLNMPLNEEQAQKLIIEQLYLAGVWENHSVTWQNFIRTGYPVFDYYNAWFNPISVNPPRRFDYPDSEINDNPNCPVQPDIYTSGCTWDNKPGRWTK